MLYLNNLFNVHILSLNYISFIIKHTCDVYDLTYNVNSVSLKDDLWRKYIYYHWTHLLINIYTCNAYNLPHNVNPVSLKKDVSALPINRTSEKKQIWSASQGLQRFVKRVKLVSNLRMGQEHVAGGYLLAVGWTEKGACEWVENGNWKEKWLTPFCFCVFK